MKIAFATSVFLVGVLLMVSTVEGKKRDFSTVTKLQALFDSNPELYWIEDGAIYKYSSAFQTAGNKLPFVSLFGSRHSEKLGNGTVEQISVRGAIFSDISADNENGLIALDSRDRQIVQVPTGGGRSWDVLVKPTSMLDPVAAVSKGKLIYVIDKGDVSLKVFRIRNGDLLQTLPLGPLLPDRIVAGEHEIVGINFSTKTVSRYLLRESKTAPATEGQVVAIQSTVISGLEKPTDLAMMASVCYIIDRGRNQLAVWSPSIGDLTFTTYAPFAVSPVALASDGAHLYFADDAKGAFQVLQRVEPVDFLFNGDDSSAGLVILYEYLRSIKLLPEDQYTVQSGDSVESIVQNRGILPAGYTDSFVGFFCKLNRSSCENGIPSLTPGTSVSLPNLPLQMFVGKKYVDLDALQIPGKTKITLADVVDSAAKNSKIANVGEQLRAFNPQFSDAPLEQQTSGKFDVPAIIVRTTAIVSSQVRKKNYSLRRKLKGKAELFQFSDDIQQKQLVTSANEMDSARLNFASAGTNEPRIPPPYFESIHRVLPTLIPPIDVAIVDSPLNVRHPEFVTSDNGSRLEEYIPPGSNVSPTTTVMISADAANALPVHVGVLDHGTHTAALIGGTNVGVNPTAQIKYVRFSAFPASVTQGSIKLFNLSLGEPEYATTSIANGGVADVLYQWRALIQEPTHFDTLFIIAAGNSRSQVVNSMLAASGTSSNVIVVAAADDEHPPRRWMDVDGIHGSNIGFEYVHVFAPGQNIESATFSGSYGVASGTSDATAIVTGLASVLRATNSSWWPWQIKERMLATSDLEPWVQDQDPIGGLINVERALLNPNFDYVTFDNQHGAVVQCAGIISDLDKDRILAIKPSTLNSQINIQLKDLKRLHSRSNLFSFIFEYQDPKRARDRDFGWEIERLPEEVPLNNLSNFHDIRWAPDPGSACAGMSKLNLDQVVDFIARMRN